MSANFGADNSFVPFCLKKILSTDHTMTIFGTSILRIVLISTFLIWLIQYLMIGRRGYN
jgi:hypothetical protein